MTNISKLVVDMGFGDSGKGLVTNWLADKDTTVVRYCGGPQAGHTVVTKNNGRHVFSSIGSGTFKGADTLWLKECPFNPSAFLKEYKKLLDKGLLPSEIKVMVSPMSPLIIPQDLYLNQTDEYSKGKTCGAGINHCITRHQFHKVYAQDIYFPELLKYKLKNISAIYHIEDDENEQFLKDCEEVANIVDIWMQSDEDTLKYNTKTHIIYESAQGIMLDQNIGVFPYVTRSNILPIFAEPLDIYMVTRAYQTRHGDGPMFTSDLINCGKIDLSPDETNVENKWQGKFRTLPLSMKMLQYSLDQIAINLDLTKNQGNIVITCLDQVEDPDNVINIIKHKFRIYNLNYYGSYSPYSESIFKL